MPPARAKKTRASTSSNEAIPSFPAPPTTVATIPAEQHTPERSPSKRLAGITQAQKQALVDNLQLEITERARKLRAQYALQAQGLRARLEMRVNRIPMALRKRNMQDLLDEHAEKAKPAPPPPVPAKDTTISERSMAAIARSPERKSLKRQSDYISHDQDNDKENGPPQSSQDLLPNPKKRAKTTTATANTKATRTTSRKIVPSSVLSPKSHNSRTLPRSPFKSAPSPEKTVPHYASPIKSHLAPPGAAGSRATSRQTAKRPGTAMTMHTDTTEGRSSEASTTSAGTTIVTKAAPAKKGAVGRKPAAAKTTAAAGRAKKEVAAPVVATTGGGRTLRKRG